MKQQSTAVTWLPTRGSYISGYHEQAPHISTLLASAHLDGTGKDAKLKTILHNPQIKSLAASINNNRTKIYGGQLSAADFEANRANLDSLILIRLYNQIMGEQEKWFHLDDMFNNMNVDGLLYRVPFKDAPAAAQDVPRRGEYDTSKVNFDEINLDLHKIVVSHDMPIEDPLRALINPLTPLQSTDEYSMAYHREREALAALQQLKYFYKKDAKGEERFTTTDESTIDNDNTARVANPNSISANATHSTYKMVNEMQDMRNAFMAQYDIILTHFAMSPRTAMNIAQNTWTEPNTIFNVEAYRTSGGSRPFPGLSGATAVISQIVPDNVIYAGSKPNNIFIKAEGPKITKTWEDNNHWTTQTATADFHQYKCAHEDLSITRKFGIIIPLSSTA